MRHTGKVFGIGLERTGTTSLTDALIALGYRAKHYPEDDATQAEISEYITTGAHTIHLSILREYDALTDTPICCIYRGLDHGYPGSKFILTVREREAWLRSREKLRKAIMVPRAQNFGDDHPVIQYSHLIGECLYGRYGYDPVRAYEAYVSGVREFFKDRPEQLLEMDICAGDGWAALASFLGTDVPDVPFPWKNRL